METSKSVTSAENPSALPDSWVERIFQRMEDFYGAKWADQYGSFPRDRVKATWARELAILATDEIKRGLEACRFMKFPPTLPEFMTFCRPPVEYERLFIGAANSVNSGQWQSRIAYWATQAVGSFDVRNEPYKRMETRWKKAVDELMQDGELPEIPPRREALPAPGQQSISKEEAKQRAAEIGVRFGNKNPKDWAQKIIAAQEGRPFIAIKFAKEALGVFDESEAA